MYFFAEIHQHRLLSINKPLPSGLEGLQRATTAPNKLSNLCKKTRSYDAVLSSSATPPRAAALASAASRSALLLLFSNSSSRLSCNSWSCRFDTPSSQYPKEPPTVAKTGYAQRPSLMKNGRISMPSCQIRTRTPVKTNWSEWY
jgi:hypothetical protein